MTPSPEKEVPTKPHGMFNAAKCVQYLRWIGVEVDDATAQSWLDAEKAHRFLKMMKRPQRTGWDSYCAECGFHEYIERRRGARRKKKRDACPDCGSMFWSMSRRFDEAVDGTVRDYRPESERWRPLDEAGHA